MRHEQHIPGQPAPTGAVAQTTHWTDYFAWLLCSYFDFILDFLYDSAYSPVSSSIYGYNNSSAENLVGILVKTQKDAFSGSSTLHKENISIDSVHQRLYSMKLIFMSSQWISTFAIKQGSVLLGKGRTTD